MALKNYTSTISASKSISFIENKLVANKARDILKRYDDKGRVESIMFIIPVNGNDYPFKLPARLSECEKILQASLSQRARPETRRKVKDQAEKTAWKIIADWVDAQMALIELQQAEMMEIFMPYLYNHQKEKTYFEIVKEKGFKAMIEAPK